MIEFRNVTKSYGDFTAVEDISFSACDSSVCGLIGYNGAGKTTLIKCAAGLYKPDSGKVLIDGESTYNSDEVRSRLLPRRLDSEQRGSLLQRLLPGVFIRQLRAYAKAL